MQFTAGAARQQASQVSVINNLKGVLNMSISKTLDALEAKLMPNKAAKTKAAIVAKTGVPADKLIVKHVTGATGGRAAASRITAAAKPTAKQQPTRDIRVAPKMPLLNTRHATQGNTAPKPAKAAKEKAPAKLGTKADKNDYAIKVLVQGNPKREGTPSHTRFGLYAKHKTASAFKAAGGTGADLSWDVAHGFIALTVIAAK